MAVDRLMDILSRLATRSVEETGPAALCRVLGLGEGPALDAHDHGVSVLAPHLAGDHRWPAFAPAAVQAGARGVVSVPARVGAVRLGSFTAWQDRSGALTDDQHADLLVLGEVAARLLLDTHIELSPTGPALVSDQDLELDAVVHQHQALQGLDRRTAMADCALLMPTFVGDGGSAGRGIVK